MIYLWEQNTRPNQDARSVPIFSIIRGGKIGGKNTYYAK